MKNQPISLEELNLEEKIIAVENITNGQVHSFTRKQLDKSGYYTIKRYMGRFVPYAKVVGKEISEDNGNSSNRLTIIKDKLYYFTNTGNYQLSVKTTKNPYHKTKVNYFNSNGEEISKEEYETVCTIKKSSKPTIMFYLPLMEIVEIK